MKQIEDVRVGQELMMRNGRKVTVKDVLIEMGLIIGGQQGVQNEKIRVLHAWHLDGRHVDDIPGYSLQM